MAPRFVLNTLSFAGADLQTEPVMVAARPSRRRSREPVWAGVLAQACTVASMLPEECRLSLPIELSGPVPDDFVLHLVRAVTKAGIRIGKLDFEFSETCITPHSQAMYYSLAALRDHGAGLILAGLGTGTTSLTLLRDRVLAGLLTGIRLDRQILQRDPSHAGSGQSLARVLVSLGNDFGLSTRADGVDSQETLTFLKEIGCQEGRGSILGRPEPVPAFIASCF